MNASLRIAANHSQRKLQRALFWMFVSALLARLIVLGAVCSSASPPFDWAPQLETYRVAYSLATGHGFSSPFESPSGPTAFLLPVYPLFVAGLFKLFAPHIEAAIVAVLTVNSVVSALACLPVFFLARRVTGSESTAMRTGWAWAFFPYAVYIPVTQFWEASLTPFLLASLLLLTLRLVECPGLPRWLAFGALWGVAALTTSSMLLVLPVCGLWAAYHIWKRRGAWLQGATLSALVFLLILSPWFLRNGLVFGQFVPFRSNLPLELYVGNTMETDVKWRNWLHPNESKAALHEFVRLGETAYMKKKGREFAQFWRTHPGTFAWLTCKRVLYFWTWIWDVRPQFLWGQPLDSINIPLATFLTGLGFLGLRDLLRKNPPMGWLFLMIFLFMPLVYYLTHINLRYRHPIDALLIILALPVLLRSASARA